MRKNELHFEKLFNGLCIVAAFMLTSYCIYIYWLDEDLVQMYYKGFHEAPDDIYPSLTYCLHEQIIEERLKNIDKSLSILSYKKFLSGDCPRGRKTWKNGEEIIEYPEIQWCDDVKRNDSWIDIDYDDVTSTLDDFLLNFIVFFTNDRVRNDLVSYSMVNGSLVLMDSTSTEEYRHLSKLNYTISVRQHDYKCFTFDLPFMKERTINKVEITMNADSFPDNIISPRSEYYFITMSYPNQVIRSLERNRIYLRPQTFPTNCYIQDTFIGSMEVLKRRNKRLEPCIEDWNEHDKYVLDNIAEKAKCIPKHWKINSTMKYCSSNEEFEFVQKEYNKIKGLIPPCRSIEKLSQTSFETDLGFRCTFTGNWRLMLTFDFHKEVEYKEVYLVRLFCLQSLVGNSG